MEVNSLSQLVDFSSLSCMTKFTLTDFGTQFFTVTRIGATVRLQFQLLQFNRGRYDGCVGVHYSPLSQVCSSNVQTDKGIK
jgi:hypothetical protein